MDDKLKQERYAALVARHGDFLLGADPEFRFKGIKARNIVPFEGKFGADGPNSQIVELRPDPKYTPELMIKEFESLLRSGWRMYPEARKTKWLAGSFPDGHPVGGHIHFGIMLAGNESILDALDKFLAPLILLLEEEADAKQRRRTDYGKLSGDYRGFDEKPYGFEYRGPASWLVSKQITKAVFAVAKVIGYEYMQKRTRNHMGILLQTMDVNASYKDAYKMCNKTFFRAFVPTIHRALRSMTMFELYEEDINYLFSMIYQNKSWNAQDDMIDRWGIGKSVCLTTSKDGKVKPFAFNLEDVLNPQYRWNPNNNNEFVNRFFLP